MGDERALLIHPKLVEGLASSKAEKGQSGRVRKRGGSTKREEEFVGRIDRNAKGCVKG